MSHCSSKFLALLICITVQVTAVNAQVAHQAPAPLYRDPVYDGAADPVMIWNKTEKSWWMLYTCRRANLPTYDVSAYFGNKVGAASTDDHGRTWTFRGYLDLEFEAGWNTFWAPDVVFRDGVYHMFVVYIKGVRNHWGGKSNIVHYTSKNLWDWKHEKILNLSSHQVIDATIFQKPDGMYRMWYKDDSLGGITMMSESKDLYNWSNAKEPIIKGRAHEGPKVFEFKGSYWMLTDEWHGLRVYKSKDLDHWEKQGLILDKPSARADDTPSGAHADVVVAGEKAYIFYFTHPGRKSHSELSPDPTGTMYHNNHRTAIQVAPLEMVNGTLEANRDRPFDFYLPDMK